MYKTNYDPKKFDSGSDGTLSVKIENCKFSREPFRYEEDAFLQSVLEYIEATYRSHYTSVGRPDVQTIDYIQSQTNSLDFLMGNVIKYVTRYGKKDGYQEKDLMKAIHYIAMLRFFSKDMKKEKP